jgi:DNA-binding transcriptional MerR regulator/methylmalonyl-CoA mutase cobalamin-binding subunit
MSETQHSIKAVARRTGLSPHVIRVWERRYGAVTPVRTGTNRRVYSDSEVERLDLLRRAIGAGHSIGNIAQLPSENLTRLAAVPAPAVTPPKAGTVKPEQLVAECLEAVKELNTRALEEVLTRGSVALGQHGLLERVVAPLARQIGDLWRDGTIMAAHEHFASSIIRSFLTRNSKPYALDANAPMLLVATPAGQLHELGAVMVAAAANDLGWRVVYCGASLPASEIAGAAAQNRARAVALSIVYPDDDPNLPGELENLRQHLPAEIRIIAGGRASGSYAPVLEKIHALRAEDLRNLYDLLENIRKPGGAKRSAKPRCLTPL